MDNKEVVLKKVPIKILLDVLQDAWDRGADYIDIIGIPDTVQDNIVIAIKEEYFSTEDSDEELDIDVELDDNLTDDDLNQLI